MEKRKKQRKIFKKDSFILKCIVIFIVYTLTLMVTIHLEVVKFKKNSDSSIKIYKEEAYDLYNYGLKDSYYNNIKIQTPNAEDVDTVFNEGVKYVVHKDLLNMELDESYYKINYKDSSFYFYEDYKIMSIKIIIDPVNSDNISYYTYKEQIKLKAIVDRMLFCYGFLLLYYCFIFMIRSKNKQNKIANAEQQDKEPKNKNVKKNKNK